MRVGQCEEEENGEIAPGSSVIPVPPTLQKRLQSILQSVFPSTRSLSILLVHTTQLEQVHISAEAVLSSERQRYHAASSFLVQVLENVRRAIRNDDQIFVDEGRGAMILFPDVDQHGISTILERVYYNVNLLQSETVLPPLQHETDIFIGTVTFYQAEGAEEPLQFSTSSTIRRLTLRPAIRTQLWKIQQEQHGQQNERTEEGLARSRKKRLPPPSPPHGNNAPFMHLPATLPNRLKHLIPYDLALELHCAPVGRAHFRLTIAMANPADKRAVNRLYEYTGMTIFPVSCELAELDALLADRWR